MFSSLFNLIVALIAFLLVLYFVYSRVKGDAGNAVSASLESINPVSQENIFSSGVNAIGATLTGDKNFKLGAWIYEKTH